MGCVRSESDSRHPDERNSKKFELRLVIATEMITFDEFKKLEIRVGEILSAEKVPETDKLLKLSVAMGEESPRQIISGIAEYFPEPEKLVGKKVAFAANLESRVIRGLESQGMILAAKNNDGGFSLLEVDGATTRGTVIS